MDEIKELVQRFRAEKRIDSMMIFGLEIMKESREAQENQISKLGESLVEMEEALASKGITVELAHLAKHAEFFDEFQHKAMRKRFLDQGGSLRRDL